MLNIREQQPSGFQNSQPFQVAKHVKSKQCLLGKTKSKAYAGKCCISFLFLLQQITTNIEAINNTNLVSYNLVVRSPKRISDSWNQGVTRHLSSRGFRGESVPCLYQHQKLSTVLGSWSHQFDLWLCHHIPLLWLWLSWISYKDPWMCSSLPQWTRLICGQLDILYTILCDFWG